MATEKELKSNKEAARSIECFTKIPLSFAQLHTMPEKNIPIKIFKAYIMLVLYIRLKYNTICNIYKK